MGAIIPQRAARSTLNVPAGGERAELNARQRNSTGESSERCTAADTPFSEHILRISDSPRTMNAAACCRRLDYLRQENDKLRDKIAQIRLVDRAKCYLIEHKGMSEAEAHRMIEKTAMDTRRDRAEVAAEILEEE